MDAESYHQLQILNHVEETPVLTNRLLSSKMGVSVKLAHHLIKRMVAKGLLHIQRRDGRSWYYFLTPAGAAEKLRLTYQFLEFSKQFYHEARKRSSEVCLRLTQAGVRRVAFLGVGELAEISYLGLAEHKLRLVDVFGEPARAGELFLGHVVRPIEDLDQTRAERVLVTLYDPSEPMKAHYLPEGVAEDERLVWVFDHAQMLGDLVDGLPPGPREAAS